MIVIKNARLRSVLKTIIPFVLIPAAVIFGALVFREKIYIYVSIAVAVLSFLLFVSGFERKKTGTRRLIIIAVMVALSALGRFFPFFKPVTAFTVITAVWLGGESGFLVGSLSAIISNFWFGQGPWTPFQMLAWGMIGLFAGFLAPILKKNRLCITLYGLVSGVVYSMIMDVWTVLWYNGTPEFSLYVSAIVTALPYTVLYAVSNVIFLWLFAKPFGDKLERVKIKYGV